VGGKDISFAIRFNNFQNGRLQAHTRSDSCDHGTCTWCGTSGSFLRHGASRSGSSLCLLAHAYRNYRRKQPQLRNRSYSYARGSDLRNTILQCNGRPFDTLRVSTHLPDSIGTKHIYAHRIVTLSDSYCKMLLLEISRKVRLPKLFQLNV
jgi:hypothetical protein